MHECVWARVCVYHLPSAGGASLLLIQEMKLVRLLFACVCFACVLVRDNYPPGRVSAAYRLSLIFLL